MERLQPQPSDNQEFTALQAQVDEWGWTRAMHYHRDAKLARELLSCGEMIRMRMRIDEISDAQSALCSQSNVAVDLAKLRIDQHCGASLLATYEVRPAAADGHCFK